jgi:hypothetical protein
MPLAPKNSAAVISPGPMPRTACVLPDIAYAAALGGNSNRGGCHYVCGPFQDTTVPRIAAHVDAFTTGHAGNKDAAHQQRQKGSAPHGRLTVAHRMIYSLLGTANCGSHELGETKGRGSSGTGQPAVRAEAGSVGFPIEARGFWSTIAEGICSLIERPMESFGR